MATVSDIIVRVDASELRPVIEEACDKMRAELQPIYQQVAELSARNTALEDVLNLFAQDPHRFGSRPCATCTSISTMLKQSWGCIKVAQQSKPKAGAV